jgi:hypothetical protein
MINKIAGNNHVHPVNHVYDFGFAAVSVTL